MGYINGTHRSERLLFPEALDDYITPENPVRFIDAFIASLDLVELGFTHAEPASTGRPAYDPASDLPNFHSRRILWPSQDRMVLEMLILIWSL